MLRRSRFGRRPALIVGLVGFALASAAGALVSSAVALVATRFVEGVGVAAGPITGGLQLEHFYWGSVFWALAPLALVTAVAAYVLVPESRDPSVPPLDLPGLGLSVAMLVTLTDTISEAPARG